MRMRQERGLSLGRSGQANHGRVGFWKEDRFSSERRGAFGMMLIFILLWRCGEVAVWAWVPGRRGRILFGFCGGDARWISEEIPSGRRGGDFDVACGCVGLSGSFRFVSFYLMA